MKQQLKQLIENCKLSDQQAGIARQAEIDHVETKNERRNFLKKTMLGGLSLGALVGASIEDTMAHTTSKVNRFSSPADLKITDMRVAVLRNVGRTPIIRIDTNQGIYGLGEVRDGADERYALMLKSRILGLNPCNVEQLWKIINPFGGHGRLGGGVCAVEMALWDLCGKAYNVPAWQLLGGRYRDKVRLYADTPEIDDPSEFAKVMKQRTVDQGFTWLKMDLGIHVVADQPDTLVNSNFWNGAKGQYDTRLYELWKYATSFYPGSDYRQGVGSAGCLCRIYPECGRI